MNEANAMDIMPDPTYGNVTPIAGGYTQPAMPGSSTDSTLAIVQAPAVLTPPIQIGPNPVVNSGEQQGSVTADTGAATNNVNIQGTPKSQINPWLVGFIILGLIYLSEDSGGSSDE